MKTIFLNKARLSIMVGLLACTQSGHAELTLFQAYENMANTSNNMYREAAQEKGQGRMSASYSAKLARTLTELQTNLKETLILSSDFSESEQLTEPTDLLIELATEAVRNGALQNISMDAKQVLAKELENIEVVNSTLKGHLDEVIRALAQEGIMVRSRVRSYRTVSSRDVHSFNASVTTSSTAVPSSSKSGFLSKIFSTRSNSMTQSKVTTPPPLLAVADAF